MIDTKSVDAFVSRLAENARYLRSHESELPGRVRHLAAAAIHDLEQSAEELRVTNEELKAQNDLLVTASASIQMERARFRRLFDLAPDALIVTDLNGVLLDCNRAGAKLLDADRNVLQRKPLAALLDADSVRAFRAALVSLSRLEEVKDLELRLKVRSGKHVPVSARAAHLPATDGEEARIAWALHDGSDREQLEVTQGDLAKEKASREVAEAVRDVAEDQSRGRSRALAGLSHELRTPLHSILGYCELLLEGVSEPLPPKAERFVRAIRSSALHQVTLVDDILAISKRPGQDPPLTASEVAVQEAIAECVGMIEERARRRGLVVETEVQDGLSLNTDRGRLIQILVNLLTNAVKFTDRGKISISAASDGDDKVVFEVRDTGRGIAAAELPHVFDAFWQGHASEKSGSDGAGLGLALVRRLSTALGGEVTVESENGNGSTFKVYLPLRTPTPQHDGDGKRESRTAR